MHAILRQLERFGNDPRHRDLQRVMEASANDRTIKDCFRSWKEYRRISAEMRKDYPWWFVLMDLMSINWTSLLVTAVLLYGLYWLVAG